ncbi:MAG TPA: hypothetical protein PLY88_06790 [Candidatus Omnitrophota bacterium]|nr:hypothetical protein [Candidatus Omnitrophota bacterium]
MSKAKMAQIEKFYKKSPKELLSDLYVEQGMSCPQISQEIKKNAKVSISERNVRRWVVKFNLGRTQEQSMVHRVIKGRMNYEKRKPARFRSTNYEKRDYETRGELWAVRLKAFMVATLFNNRSFAQAARCNEENIVAWKYKRRKVSKRFQQSIADVFGVAIEDIFSKDKGEEIPKLGPGGASDVKGRLIKAGWRYLPKNSKKFSYQSRAWTINELAKNAKLNSQRPGVSNILNGNRLVNPNFQIWLSCNLSVPIKILFPDFDAVVINAVLREMSDEERNKFRLVIDELSKE